MSPFANDTPVIVHVAAPAAIEQLETDEPFLYRAKFAFAAPALTFALNVIVMLPIEPFTLTVFSAELNVPVAAATEVSGKYDSEVEFTHEPDVPPPERDSEPEFVNPSEPAAPACPCGPAEPASP